MVTVMVFKEHPTQIRSQTRRRGIEKPLPTQAVGREEAESSPERHFQHPRGQASQSSGMEATLSQGWARLGPRPLKGQDWGKAKRRQESERKLKSRQGHMFAEHLLCAGPGAWPRVGDQPASCPLPSSERLCSMGLPLDVGTRGSGGNKRLYKDPCFNCFVLKNDGFSPSCSDFVFFLPLLPLTQHLGLRSRVIHWLMNSPPDVGYWNAQPTT